MGQGGPRAPVARLPDLTPAQRQDLSRLLKRLLVHRLIKKVGRRYKYYLTDFGRQVATLVLDLRELHAIPALARPPSAS
jgi:DNA-binding IclR family transcriptional regulator